MLVRTWNVFHGNTVPPGREGRLEDAVRLAAADRPEILCLQEVPVWALELLDDWSGMVAVGQTAARPRLGSAELGRRVTNLDHGRLRSAFTGQANAILVGPALRVLERHALVLNPLRFRRREAARLRLSLAARLAWAKERRACQAVRVALPEAGTALIANHHATIYARDRRLADAELLRAAVFVDAVARPGEPCLLAGDFNVRPGRSRTLAELTGPEWGFFGPGPAIDHVLVRGLPAGPAEVWPEERRRVAGALLSDHAPVDVTVG